MMALEARAVYLVRAGIGSFCSGLIFISLAAYYVRTIGMNPLQLMLVGTALEATVFLFEVPTGIVADLYSRRLSVLIGGFLIGACYVTKHVSADDGHLGRRCQRRPHQFNSALVNGHRIDCRRCVGRL